MNCRLYQYVCQSAVINNNQALDSAKKQRRAYIYATDSQPRYQLAGNGFSWIILSLLGMFSRTRAQILLFRLYDWNINLVG